MWWDILLMTIILLNLIVKNRSVVDTANSKTRRLTSRLTV